MSEAAGSLRDMVCDQVRQERAAHGLDRAYHLVARRIGILPRRVRAWWYGEVKDPRDSEGQRIRRAYAAWLEQEERAAERRVEELRGRRAAMRRRIDAIEARL